MRKAVFQFMQIEFNYHIYLILVRTLMYKYYFSLQPLFSATFKIIAPLEIL